MKKQLLKITLLLAASVTLLQSCSDDESKNTATVNMGSATITGRVTADVILNNGVKKDGLAGFTVTATISTQDLVTVPSGTYPNKTYTAVTDANGNYTLSVEANVKPVNVTINYPNEFYGAQITESNTSRRVRYFGATPAGGAGFQVTNGQVVTRDIDLPNYDDANQNLGLGKVMGEVYFRNDVCKSASATLDSTVSLAPEGTVLIVEWNDPLTGKAREMQVKTDANGKFEFNVETANAQNVTIRGLKFTAARKEVQSGNCVTVASHEYNLTPVVVTATKGETFSTVSASKLPITGTIIRFQ